MSTQLQEQDFPAPEVTPGTRRIQGSAELQRYIHMPLVHHIFQKPVDMALEDMF